MSLLFVREPDKLQAGNNRRVSAPLDSPGQYLPYPPLGAPSKKANANHTPLKGAEKASSHSVSFEHQSFVQFSGRLS